MTCLRDNAHDVVDYAMVVLKYHGAVRRRVVLHMSRLVAANTARFEAHGTKGSFVSHHLDVQEDQLKANMTPGATNWGIDRRPALFVDGTTGIQSDIEREAGDYRCYYNGVRDSILHSKPNPGSFLLFKTFLFLILFYFISSSIGSIECDEIDAIVHRQCTIRIEKFES